MSEPFLSPVAAHGMRVAVELGPSYRPSTRVAAALTELRDALRFDAGLDVGGFEAGPLQSFAYAAGAGTETTFLEGDPDRPLILGRLWPDTSRPPES
jgi:hypothetical protein